MFLKVLPENRKEDDVDVVTKSWTPVNRKESPVNRYKSLWKPTMLTVRSSTSVDSPSIVPATNCRMLRVLSEEVVS